MNIRPRILAAALAALTLLPALTWAQTPVTFGIKAGVNGSTFSVEDRDLAVKRIWGAAAGVFLGTNLTDNVGLQVEGLFSQRGAEDTTNASVTKIRLTYLDIPVTLRLGSTGTNRTHFHVFTGPQVSLKIDAKGSDEIFGDISLDDEVENMDFGWTLGAGVEQGRLSLDARYTLGLKNISVATADGTIRNRTFTILLGYRLM